MNPAASPDPNPPPSSATTTTTISDPLKNPYTSLSTLCHDLSSLQDLATRGAWKSILDKINHARSLNLLNKPHEHLTYLTFNVLALTKLRRPVDANQELETLLVVDSDNDFNDPQFYYQTYPQHYPNMKGNFVPFALRWLHAYLPYALNQPMKSFDRFYTLLNFIRSKKDGNDLWKRREIMVLNSIISQHLSRKDFKLCLVLLNELVGLCGEGDPNVLSKLGYVKMQYGDVEGAKKAFKLVEGMVNSGSEVCLRNLVSRNKALLFIVEKDYVSAVREYEECIERDGMDMVAMNNKALCLMYSRDLSDAIKVLENALERVPTVALNETLVVNLCSMYELAYVNHADIKRTLNSWIARVAPDDFDASCTRT
ncbi:trafficking protein particle complex subunit 12 [Capsicum chacoense]